VSQLRSHPVNGDVRVAGVVQTDVQKSDGGLHVMFTEKDGTASVPVEYTGTLPDIFKPGITVVAEGKLGSDGVFHARTLLAKCPSRFSTTPYTQ
jgi:cytochrome c-type biogenesis protein CcmE